MIHVKENYPFYFRVKATRPSQAQQRPSRPNRLRSRSKTKYKSAKTRGSGRSVWSCSECSPTASQWRSLLNGATGKQAVLDIKVENFLRVIFIICHFPPNITLVTSKCIPLPLRSQLATIVLAGVNDVAGVCVGGTMGHFICTGLAGS